MLDDFLAILYREDGAAESARAGRLVDIEDRLPFLVSASKDQLRKSTEHDQQDLHRDHLVDRADISLI